MASFEYFRPTSLVQALDLLSDLRKKGLILAGGTDIIPLINAHSINNRSIVDIKSIQELGTFSVDDQGALHIGASTCITDLIRDSYVNDMFPALAQGGSVLGSYPVRNRATIGGNICRASPSGDLLPPLLIYEAQLVIFGQGGYKNVSIMDFFIGPGKTIMAEDEILVEVILPKVPPSVCSGYLKYSRREAMDLAVVGVAAMLIPTRDSQDELRLALGAVGPTPFRAKNVEQAWKISDALDCEEAGALASVECQPIDDIRSSAEYRRKIVSVLTNRLLIKLSHQP